MHAYQLDAFGATASLRRHARTIPEPGPHEVLVRIHACSVNYRDLLIRDGRYPITATAGVVPLSDGAGEVAHAGAEVSRVVRGDRVAATYFPRWIDGPFRIEHAMEQFGCTRDGMLADYVLVHEQALVKIPEHLSYQEAACLPCAALTAWSALAGGRRILPGETVLTIGTGGVALFALQFAKLFGARVVSITSAAQKEALLHELGADEVLNYRSNPEWDLAVRRLTDGRGAEHVVETGALDSLPKAIRATAPGGEVTLVAAVSSLARPGDAIDPRLLGGLFTLRRVFVGCRTSFEEMMRAIGLHGIRPVIGKRFSMAEADLAYEYLRTRQHVGKIVISNV